MISKDIKIQMPKWVRYIINTLEDFDYEAYIVGGCVRDSLLNRNPNDWDITTNAKPQDVIEIFESLGYKIIPTGLKHGTVTILINDMPIEVTTYRIDGAYDDNRHPKEVTFTNSLKEDLSRRDFTINAIAYNDKEGLVDYFGGLRDLEYKELNCVGNAEERFKEDKLRILRAIRFASAYDLEIYRNIIYAIEEDNDLSKLSKERVKSEFNKIMLSKKPSIWLNLMLRLGLLEQIVPEIRKCFAFDQLNPHHNKNVFDHILDVVDNTDPILELRLSALFHDIGKPKCFSLGEDGVGHFYSHQKESAKICENRMRKLKYSNKEIENVRELVYWHMNICDNTSLKSIKKFIKNISVDRLEYLFKLKVADISASVYCYEDYADIFKTKYECERVLNEKQPLTIKDLDINGYDLMKLGINQGKEIGIMLNKLLDVILENPNLNNKEDLIKIVKDNL
ncbi:CCA tRNA nucleotidyltransferase [Clostridium botulinum]|uniref:CCA tRNA nucleotidyltransferase n=2 Tax=Clostridium botulinum TaxID=1491 RepID=UPI00090ACD3F|nr:CCA tRNA nucleotidyltransferase [Clostridium botulinum]APH21010.1 HDIG domain protein [Clostridium botulinum]APQ71157.1 HDIG domain protein [Clostridium botulinum]MBN3379058.1 polynucleotide adenylyltransferase [Clostridium botulinum]